MTSQELDIVKEKIRERYKIITGDDMLFFPFYHAGEISHIVFSTLYQGVSLAIVISLDNPLRPDQTILSYIMDNFVPQYIEYL